MEVEVQDHQEQKQHLCKLCNKSFSNGKVLGGHMRSHRSSSSTQNNNPAKKRKKNSIAASYSLRENPKKSWKFSAPNPQTQTQTQTPFHCKICGKAFDSSKALFGHMRHHSGRRKEPIQISKQKQCNQHLDIPQSHAQTNNFALLRRKRSTRRTYSNPAAAASSSSSSDFKFDFSSSSLLHPIDPDVQDLALCLLMLSKGAEFTSQSVDGSHSSAFEAKSPFNRQAHLDLDSEEDDETLKLGLFPEVGSYYADQVELGIPKLDDDEDESEMGFCETVGENGLKSLKKCEIEDFSVEVCEAQKDEEIEKEGNHQCDVCLKVFGSGQALGGHKRAHLLKPSLMELEEEDENENEEEEEDDDDEFKPWWNGDDDNGGQQLVGGLPSSN